jgi:uncharacterized protein (TIGR01244 family)
MTQIIPLDDRTCVAGQIAPSDLAAVAAAGVRTVVNNRPDFEEPGQPTGAEIRAAAEAAGLAYRHVPVAGGLSAEQVSTVADLLGASEDKLLLFCRTGTRSTYLWALAEASRGADPETLIAQAAVAGYDLSSLRPYL